LENLFLKWHGVPSFFSLDIFCFEKNPQNFAYQLIMSTAVLRSFLKSSRQWMMPLSKNLKSLSLHPAAE
jgi:hypothetical protein